MMLNPEQAKKLWCPMVRNLEMSDTGAGQAMAGVNAEIRNDQRFNCIADGCMMWHWENPNMDIPSPDRRGFCGLAGKPV